METFSCVPALFTTGAVCPLACMLLTFPLGSWASQYVVFTGKEYWDHPGLLGDGE